MDKQAVKSRGNVAQEKTQVNWRINKKVVNALRADADRKGFTSIPALLNHLLTLHYFGEEPLSKSGVKTGEE